MPLEFLKNTAKTFLKKIIRDGLKDIFFPKEDKPQEKQLPRPGEAKSHPWRLCPTGQHWVTTHPLTVPASNEGPERTTTRHGHCRTNPGRAEYYTADELREIALQHFSSITNNPEIMPIPDTLGFPNGNKYDEMIGGWTKFWNDILVPKKPLSPDLIKALIATESSFEILPDTKSQDGSARGLIQITENTRKIMQNAKGELRNHLIKMTIEESREPEVNIAAGVRWLHHKKYLTEHRLKREISWEEAIAEYKGIYNQLGKVKKSDRIIKDLNDFTKRLRNKRNSK